MTSRDFNIPSDEVQGILPPNMAPLCIEYFKLKESENKSVGRTL